MERRKPRHSPESRKRFAQKIRQLRKSLGRSRKWVADRLGVTEPAIEGYEKGKVPYNRLLFELVLLFEQDPVAFAVDCGFDTEVITSMAGLKRTLSRQQLSSRHPLIALMENRLAYGATIVMMGNVSDGFEVAQQALTTLKQLEEEPSLAGYRDVLEWRTSGLYVDIATRTHRNLPYALNLALRMEQLYQSPDSLLGLMPDTRAITYLRLADVYGSLERNEECLEMARIAEKAPATLPIHAEVIRAKFHPLRELEEEEEMEATIAVAESILDTLDPYHHEWLCLFQGYAAAVGKVNAVQGLQKIRQLEETYAQTWQPLGISDHLIQTLIDLRGAKLAQQLGRWDIAFYRAQRGKRTSQYRYDHLHQQFVAILG